MRGLPKRRRHEQKTDYNSRLSLLKSYKPRLVIRKTNRYMIAQIVNSKDAQDTVVLNVTSKDLLGNGWPEAQGGSLKSRVAAYLTGYLVAKSALKMGIKEAIVDMGMHRNVKKSRIFALVRGAIDGGLSLPASKEALPTDEDLKADEKNSSLMEKIRTKL
jgi:large subunit ribosomal protein L18